MSETYNHFKLKHTSTKSVCMPKLNVLFQIKITRLPPVPPLGILMLFICPVYCDQLRGKVKENPQLLVVIKTQIHGKCSNVDSGGPADNQGYLHFGENTSHFRIWLWNGR